VDRYKSLTEQALASQPPPQLLVWPETALPFQPLSRNVFAGDVRASIQRWGVPTILGAYAPHETDPARTYNAAYLLVPSPGQLGVEVYKKNILLAFGEYMPGGEWSPALYQSFPQVANFGRGTEQRPFTLPDGTRIGMTICYEAIDPAFFRQVALQRVHLAVNLTNDSWFGPTSEPYHHAALASFRTVESRIPLVRVTNTGTSLTVDAYGRLSRMTGVYEEGVLVHEVILPAEPPLTFYTRYGDWFIILCAVIVASLTLMLFRRNRKCVSHASETYIHCPPPHAQTLTSS
jgi:apolipoprotein N-acyltransferase